MDDASGSINKFAEKIAKAAASTPLDLINAIFPLLIDWDNQDWQLSIARALSLIHNPQLKSDLLNLFETWKDDCPQIPGNSIALSLLSSSFVYSNSQQVQSSLVWTGPETGVIPFRRTDQALLELIESARHKLLIVSFAVYKIKSIIEALEHSIDRGVEIKIVLENPEESQGKVSFSGHQAFSEKVLFSAQMYLWPLEKRPKAEDGSHGSLHAKIAVADGETLLISSANLTEYAMTLNMEMGVLIQEGEMPAKVHEHFERLINLGDLVEFKRYPVS